MKISSNLMIKGKIQIRSHTLHFQAQSRLEKRVAFYKYLPQDMQTKMQVN
jgi:hypothetical protein